MKLKTIASSAFIDCSALETVIIPGDSILFLIDYKAFCDCTKLQEIAIPANVTSIEEYVFSSCSILKSITFLDSNNWYTTSTYDAGTEIDFSDSEKNAEEYEIIALYKKTE